MRLAAQAEMTPVGRITGMSQCQWADPTAAAREGDPVALAGHYTLSAGLLEISFDTGAKVILQGPVRYEVQSRESGLLQSGTATVCSPSLFRLPPSPFVLHTPTADIADRGADFGVVVEPSGVSLVPRFPWQDRIAVRPRQ